ncbi:MAG TPA: TonB-dependent receptor [Pelobium sp.]|nr:TonB-dependent receptor [Pelobium sp.]
MKLVTCFLFGILMQVHATGFGQKITLEVKKASLKQVLNQIQVQTDYDFIYNSSHIRNLSVDYHVKGKELNKVLQDILSPKGLMYFIENNTVLITKKSELDADKMQLQPITGVVKDDQNNPIPGAVVKIKNSNVGTLTDTNGNFKLLSASDEGILSISMLGYETTEYPYKTGADVVIILKQEKKLLSEIVVVGYGSQTRANLTGAVAQINTADIALRPDANIASTLQGLLPGLNIQINTGDPTATPELNVRGFNSINGGSPLILIDGIEGNITRVNPNDIESVTVLKDAASAAIYGARGSFGVILITTKQGKAGKMTVDYTNNFGWTQPTTRTDFLSDPYVYAKTVDAALYGYNGTTYTGYNDLDYEALKMVANGEIPPFKELQANGTYKFFANTNWYDYMFKKFQASNFHNIAVSGGTDKLRGYLSGRVYERETINNIADDADMDRYNLKANLIFNPNPWLELSNNIQFINEKDKEYVNEYGGLWSTTTWYNLFPFYPNFVDGIPTDVGVGGTGGRGGSAAMEDGNNWRLFGTEEFTNTFRVKVTPIKNLVLNLDYSNRFENTARTYRSNEFEFLSNNKLDYTTTGINQLGEYRWKDKYNALNIFGTYTANVNKDHHIKLLLGFNQEEFDRDRIFAESNELLIRDLSNLALGTSYNSIDGSATNWAVRGFFGRFNYDYKNKYLLEINSRYDGSSRFPEDSRWGFFPSVSAGWQVDKENFWTPVQKYVSSLKIRGSYGQLGNQTVGVNTFKQLMDVGQSQWLDNGMPIIYAGAPNPLPKVVTWETTKSLDLGLDVGFLSNKLFANFDWYKKITDGMYLPGKPLPAVFGAAEPRENYASLENKGFELGLTYKDKFNLAGSPLNFNVSANISNYIGTITKYDNPNGLMSTYWEGQRLGQIWGYKVDGQFQTDADALAYQSSFTNPSNSLGNVYNYVLNVVQNSEWNHLKAGDIKYLDLDNDGRIDRGDYTLEDHGDLVPIGNAMPQFPFGVNLNANWKMLDFSIAVAGVGKQDWYPTGDIYWGPYQRPYLSFIRKDLIDNAWTPNNTQNTYPQIYRGYISLNGGRSLYEMNDYYMESVAYMRVKNLSVGITIPKKFTKKFNIERMRLFFSGENIFTWSFGGLTKYIDPEQAGSAVSYSNPGDAVNRADLRDYPMGKTYSFGLNINL